MAGEIAFPGKYALAQIVPDATLGTERSVVTPNASVDAISGGATRGANLFHSFEQFSVLTGRTAFFNNALDIQNIISRVTGSSISNIDGLIRANGTANVFLLNPNGIIFGPNASLNVGGSFVASTANAIQFGTNGLFSASTPDSASPLLTINPRALLFNQLSPAAITTRSNAPAGLNPAGVEVTGLRVPDGRSLVLVGGNVNVDGGSLRAYEGRIELAGLASPGSLGLNVAGNTLNLSVPQRVARADVSLTNGAEVNVRAANGGSIAINAQNLNLAGESKLRAGIETGLGTPLSKAGDIEINAFGETTVTDGSFIANVLLAEAVGKAGNINITTGALTLGNGASLNTSTFGQGDGGSVFVQANDSVTLVNGDIFSSVQAGAVGNGGDINIQAGMLSLTDSAQLITAVNSASDTLPNAGRGNGGNVNIFVRDAVRIAGQKDQATSGIFSRLETGAIGTGGNITVSSGALSVANGSELDASTLR